MNTSLLFSNLTEQEIIQILSVVSVPYLTEPIKAQPEKYLGTSKNYGSLSREAVNMLYMKCLKENDPDLAVYLTNTVLDIIHYYKLDDAFETIINTEDESDELIEQAASSIEESNCPISVDMFLKLLGRKVEEPEIEEPEQETVETKEMSETVEVSQEELEEDDNMSNDELQKVIADLQYQVMHLQLENENLRDEKRELLITAEDESQINALSDELYKTKEYVKKQEMDINEISLQNTKLLEQLRGYEALKSQKDKALLDLRDYKIKYISLQAEVDQMKYTIKKDSKKLKDLETKQRTLYTSESDIEMAMHDLNWYKKQWGIPGDEPLSRIWAHLNNEESTRLTSLMTNYSHMLNQERAQKIDALKEILLVKQAILVLLRQDKNKNEG